MQIYVTMKTAGKRKAVLTRKPYEVPENLHTLREILTWFTGYEVKAFNEGIEEPRILIPDAGQIADGADVGKVSFGHRYGDKKADPEEAVRVTLSAWQDGLVRVFLNDTELEELDADAALRDGDVLTFIRLTFLAGRMW